MYDVGVFPGKFYPPHRGHLSAILKAGTQCKRLYVVVSYNRDLENGLPITSKFNPITLNDRVRRLSIELQNFDHIKVLGMEEVGVPPFPGGWTEWCVLLNRTIPEKFQAVFGSDISYATEGYTTHFPDTAYVICDQNREQIPISATEIRSNPYKYWDYILGSARPHFAKRILIGGTESCGKTTLTKILAKHYNTAWTEEEGRYYSTRYLGGNEAVFTQDDFFNICCDQRQVENKALRSANKLVFFDTDSVITQYYCELYLGSPYPRIESFVDPSRYDYLLYMAPDVEWVADGFRFKNEQEERNRLNEKLLNMYRARCFKNIICIDGNYQERLDKAIKICDSIIST
jgi:HTH-type transcriptional repressor of NAD biosynthesis genes